ncbi:MAG: hypothetical protein ACXW11_08450 [Methylotenera sp.]
MNITREKEAISAYLKLLQAKGATSGMLYKRSLFLDKLTVSLAGKALDRTEYGQALDLVMKTIPADDWHESLNTAREFYPFWMKDIKAIAAFNLHYGFDIQSIQWKPLAASLKSLTDSLETEKFDDSENWALNTYKEALRLEGAENSLVDTRVKLAKIILIRLRDAPEKNHKTYRTAVDLTLPLFTIKENKHLFLVIVREFYYFWTGSPDAANKVLKDGSDNML